MNNTLQLPRQLVNHILHQAQEGVTQGKVTDTLLTKQHHPYAIFYTEDTLSYDKLLPEVLYLRVALNTKGVLELTAHKRHGLQLETLMVELS